MFYQRTFYFPSFDFDATDKTPSSHLIFNLIQTRNMDIFASSFEYVSALVFSVNLFCPPSQNTLRHTLRMLVRSRETGNPFLFLLINTCCGTRLARFIRELRRRKRTRPLCIRLVRTSGLTTRRVQQPGCFVCAGDFETRIAGVTPMCCPAYFLPRKQPRFVFKMIVYRLCPRHILSMVNVNP